MCITKQEVEGLLRLVLCSFHFFRKLILLFKVDAPSPEKAKKNTTIGGNVQAKKVSDEEVAIVEKNVRFMCVADG